MKVEMKPTTSVITFTDRWDHLLARWRINRSGHRVEPGLYSLGNPNANSPVFVTANYTLSFDVLRSSLQGINGYILVLNTEGINVWCAAGKGTFGTEELVGRIKASQLHEIVRHRTVLLPQLGAAGVAAHEVKKQTGFKVEYGPVRALDIREYLKNHQATPEMRRVYFNLRDRIILIPVEFVGALIPMVILALLVYFIAGGLWASISLVSAILSGVVLFPILLPWLPTRDFSIKGFILGGLVALILFLVKASFTETDTSLLWQAGGGISYVLVWSPVTAFVSLNFTGSTTFTSRSGVRREIFRYVRIMAGVLIAGIVLNIFLSIM